MAATAFSVGLTGGIGSGKTTVANMFATRGAAIIDTDQIAHELTMPAGIAMPAIGQQFGTEFIAADGSLDRARMRARVFADPAEKRRLEAILHPLIKSECEREAHHAQGAYLMFVVPLLVESGNWKQRVSRVLVVDCPEPLQLQRVMARSALEDTQVRAIMASQATRAQRLAAADDILLNDGDPDALAPQVDRLHALYRSLAQAGA